MWKINGFSAAKKIGKKKVSKVLDKAILPAVILPDPQNQGASEFDAEFTGLGRHYSVRIHAN